MTATELTDARDRPRAETSRRADRSPHLPHLLERARKHAFEYTFDAVVVTDLEGRIIDWNVGSERLYGYTRDEILGRPVDVLHVPEDRARILEEVLADIEQKGHWRGEIRMLHKDRHVGWIESMCVPVLDEQGVPIGALGINRDISERVETEAKLRGAEARFRSVVENSLVGILILQGGRARYVNPKLVEISGYSAEELLHEVPMLDLIEEEDREIVESNIEQLLAGGELETSYTVRARRKDGRLIHVQVHGSRIDVDGGKALFAMVQDVTEQKRAEESIRASEERLQLVARATNDAIWDFDPTSGRVEWSTEASRMFRYSPGELGDIDWWYDRIHPDDRERVIHRFQAAVEGPADSWSAEYRFRRGDGSYTTVLDRGYLVRDDIGVATRMVGSMVDVTERKRQEETQAFLADASSALDASLDRDAILTRLARIPVPFLADCCMVDLVEEGKIRRIAATAAGNSGIADERLSLDGDTESPVVLEVARTGRPLLIPDFGDRGTSPTDPDQEYEEVLRQMGISCLLLVPLRARKRTLGVITLGTSGSRRPYSGIDLTVADDLARRAAQALDNASLYRQSQAAIRARDDVLAVVSHDLRTPLNAIQMSATLLLEGKRGGEDKRWLDMILKTSEQMNTLIGDLLDLSSIEAHRFSVELAEESMAALLDETTTLLDPIAREEGVRLTTDIAPDLETLRVDADQVRRVLRNVVGNAIKFTPRGGSVAVSAERADGAVRIGVADTGPGIPPERLTHIFDRYSQERPGDRRGSGLGLAISKGIVEAHGGRIWAESKVGKGTTVLFTLPAG